MSEPDRKTIEAPPRDDLYRMITGDRALTVAGDTTADYFRAAGDGEPPADGGPVMEGHFAIFNEWTEIDSMWEGNFLERIQPGAFAKTITENQEAMRVLFQHGMDPQIGDKPLGPIRSLEEDDIGPAYEVPLLRTSYNADLEPALRAKLFGASFRFRVLREEFNEEPDLSDHNPTGLPERTIVEARVMEFGPVTFPAYAGASAGIRSITDAVRDARILRRDMPKLTEACRAVLLDETRVASAHAFLAGSAGIIPPEDAGETAGTAPSRDAADQQESGQHLSDERRGDTATGERWWETDDDERGAPEWAK